MKYDYETNQIKKAIDNKFSNNSITNLAVFKKELHENIYCIEIVDS